MSQKGSIAGSILWGVLLGFGIVTAWLFYPDIPAVFRFSAPRGADIPSAIKEKAVSVRRPILGENRESPLSAESVIKTEKEGAPDVPEKTGSDAIEASVKKTLYAFWGFDERGTAEDFTKSIKKQSGVDLELGQEGYRYVVYIPAADEVEKEEKISLIKKSCGISIN